MKLSGLEIGLWMAGFIGQFVLCAVMLFHRRWKEFPVFSALMLFEAVWGLAGYILYRYSLLVWYTRVYWAACIPDFLLQLGVIWEIARIVLKPTGSWIVDARRQFVLWGVTASLVAAGLLWLIAIPETSLIGRVKVLGFAYSDILICELCLVILFAAKHLGLGWRNHIMALVQGWTIWVLASLLVDGFHSVYGADVHFQDFEHIRNAVYVASIIYWTFQFWQDEPARRAISPELSEYILELHRRVQKDLDMINHRR